MRVLLIKTSSMGDVIHTLPALTDAGHAIKDITFDWMVEQAFAEIPLWHPLVNQIIPISLRRWRKGIFSRATHAEWRHLHQQLRLQSYDLVIDAQGLIKSAFLMLFTKGLRAGLDFSSAREALASLVYQRKMKVNFYQHAIVRMRQLFSQALGYTLPTDTPDYGLKRPASLNTSHKYIVLLHGTTWVTKQWPEAYWIKLAELAGTAGYEVKIGGGNAEEVARALRIAKTGEHVKVKPYLSIAEMAQLLAGAHAVVAVDTGFGHLSAALNVPTVSLYGATNPAYTGALGKKTAHVAADFPCAPCLNRTCTYRESSAVTPACYASLSPEKVWEAVCNLCS